MTIRNFIDKLQYDKEYALDRCLDDECWMRLVAGLPDTPGLAEKFMLFTPDEELVEFYRFIDGNGFRLNWNKVNEELYDVIMEL